MYRQNLVKMAESEQNKENENVITRVTNLPIVHSAIDQVIDYYAWTKESNQYVKSTLDKAESTVMSAASKAKPVVDPLVHKLDGPIMVANSLANKGLDIVEEKVPIITKPTDEVLTETNKLYESTLKPSVDKVTGAVQYSKDTVASGVANVKAAKDYSVNTITGAKDYSVSKVVDATQAVKSYGIDKATVALHSEYGQVALKTIDWGLAKTEEYVDYYLPPQEKGAGEPIEEPMPDVQKEGAEQTVAKVSQLSDKVRRRMYVRALRQMNHLQARSKETLDKLHFTVDLIQYARQNIDTVDNTVRSTISNAQNKIITTWEDLKTDHNDSAAGGDAGQTNPEHTTLIVARNLTNQLKAAYGNAYVATVSLLPTHLQESLTRGKVYIEELSDSFGKATHYEEISTNVLSQMKERLTYLQGTLVNVADIIISSRALSWLVPESDVDKIDLEEEFSDSDENEIIGRKESYTKALPPAEIDDDVIPAAANH